MNEGAAVRVLSFLNETSQRHLASLANEKRKVTVIGEEQEPELTQDDPYAENYVEPAILSSEQMKEFFKATEDGSIDRLEELFDSINNVDPNMTRYTESLLMTAIRAKRPKVAEYLIDQLAIDVNHSSDLLEFRPQTRLPVRHRNLSCRELAYDRGLMDLVDLIDIASDDVKPNVKRYLQRRLKTRLDEIHQAYLKRLKERNNRPVIPLEEKDSFVIEEDTEDRENDEISTTNITEEIGELPAAQFVPVQPTSARPYQSRIDETIRNIEGSNEKSIDQTGKKRFRFSGYTLRFRLDETVEPRHDIKEHSRPRTTPSRLPSIVPVSARPQPLVSPTSAAARPTTSGTAMTHRIQHSTFDANPQIPIRETRTSICRSARRVSTPRVISAVRVENLSDSKAKLSRNDTQRLLPKRINSVRKNYGYVPQPAHPTVYNQPSHFVPMTFRSTAIGLPSDYRLIRD